MLAAQRSRRRSFHAPGVSPDLPDSPPPWRRRALSEVELTAQAAALREGETRMCMMGPAGALFETDYHRRRDDKKLFTVTWVNADASGFMDETRGDRILAIRY